MATAAVSAAPAAPAAAVDSEPVPERAPKRLKRQHHHHQKQSHGTKLAPLPPDAHVKKRPLLRPALPSPHAGAAAQKVVYVGTKTPFLSAVKRVEKLLRLSDKRLVQSATQLAQNDSRRRRRRGRGEDDEIAAVTEIAEEQKRRNSDEEVVLKGSGKAITKVLDMALWFQQREQEYAVRLHTGSASSIDDVEYREGAVTAEGHAQGQEEVVEETRIRKISVLEVYVSLR